MLSQVCHTVASSIYLYVFVLTLLDKKKPPQSSLHHLTKDCRYIEVL